MKKWMRKLCGSSLVLVLVLSMMLSVTVLAENEPTLTVTGIPTGVVKAGDTVELQIKVEGVEGYTNLRYSLDGPFGSAGFVDGEIGEDGTAVISTTIMETTVAVAECGLYVSADDENGVRVFNICNQEFKLNFTQNTAQPKLTIVSGVPQGEIYTATPITVRVKAENLDPNEKYFVSVSGLWNGSERADITDGETVEVSGKTSIFESDDEYFEVSLNQVTGEGDWDYEEVLCVESSHYQTKARVELTDLKWNPVEKVVVGTAYPFSVTVRNLIDEDIPNLAVEVGTPRHIDGIKPWSPEVTFVLRDGISAKGQTVTIANLRAGESLTIEGSIIFPADAVGDATHVGVALVEDNDYIANLDTREEGSFVIVAAGSGANPGEGNGSQGTGTQGSNGQKTDGQKTDGQAAGSTVKTGDTAPLMATVAVMLISVFVIVTVARKRQMN